MPRVHLHVCFARSSRKGWWKRSGPRSVERSKERASNLGKKARGWKTGRRDANYVTSLLSSWSIQIHTHPPTPHWWAGQLLLVRPLDPWNISSGSREWKEWSCLHTALSLYWGTLRVKSTLTWKYGVWELQQHNGLQISEELLFAGPLAAVLHSFWGNKNHKETEWNYRSKDWVRQRKHFLTETTPLFGSL